MLERPIFFDTNVVVYAYGPDDPSRRQRALSLVREAMREDRFVISTQVMQEFYNVIRQRNFLSPGDALDVLRGLAGYRVERSSSESVLRAVALQQRCKVSIWDALIVQAALDSGCGTLFTEDLQHGQRFAADGDAARTVTVLNPFATDAPSTGLAVHEALPMYAVERPLRHKRPAMRRQP